MEEFPDPAQQKSKLTVTLRGYIEMFELKFYYAVFKSFRSFFFLVKKWWHEIYCSRKPFEGS